MWIRDQNVENTMRDARKDYKLPTQPKTFDSHGFFEEHSMAFRSLALLPARDIFEYPQIHMNHLVHWKMFQRAKCCLVDVSSVGSQTTSICSRSACYDSGTACRTNADRSGAF